MNARQKHGFDFEDHVILKYNLRKEEEYGNQYDAYTKEGIPVQIKFIKHKSSIELGGYFRNKNKSRDFILIIGFWTNISEVYMEYYIKVHNQCFATMFPAIEDEKTMMVEFQDISCDRKDDTRWKGFIEKYKDTSTLIQLRFKRDHKSQKRIQCAIPYRKFKEFCSNFDTTTKVINEPITIRDDKEQYYTKKGVVKDILNRVYHMFKVELIIEPSAGKGVFIDVLKELGSTIKIIGYDIEPKHPDVILHDFLQVDKETMRNALVIGNPPFGRQSSIAKKFIKHCEYAKYIAFILPRSFLKDSMNKCFPRNFHKIYEYVLPKNSFVFREKSYDVPCVFLVYENKGYARARIAPVTPNDTYTYELTEGSIAFKRVGGCAGQFIYENVESLSKQSHIFIKFNTMVDTHALDNIIWDTDNTVGPRSISKRELTIALNKIT